MNRAQHDSLDWSWFGDSFKKHSSQNYSVEKESLLLLRLRLTQVQGHAKTQKTLFYYWIYIKFKCIYGKSQWNGERKFAFCVCSRKKNFQFLLKVLFLVKILCNFNTIYYFFLVVFNKKTDCNLYCRWNFKLPFVVRFVIKQKC